MKQITIYKESNEDDVSAVCFKDVFIGDTIYLKPTQYIEIDGALYESIEHFNKVHRESLFNHAKYLQERHIFFDSLNNCYRQLLSGIKLDSNEIDLDFLKEKTK